MSDNVEQPTRTLKECLSIEDEDLDEDRGIALTSLITTAVHDKEPKHDLTSIAAAVKESASASDLEPLTVIPIVVGSADDGADTLMDLTAAECSAKEVVMAVEEVVENLERRLQSGDEEDDHDEAKHASVPRQIVRLIRAYTATIPRLPKWRKSPKEAVESRLSELESIIRHVGASATAEEGRGIIAAVSRLVLALSQGADIETKELLRRLVESTLSTFPNHIHGGLARIAFTSHFRRLVLPQSESSTSTQEDVIDTAWVALRSIGVTTASCESKPSPASLILLAHDASYTFSSSSLSRFFPVLLSSLQSSIMLDEILSILISYLAPLRSTSPRPNLDVDLIIPMIHLLPPLASNHPDPDIRHYTFRVLSLVLGLSPPPVRFQLLKDLLSDEDTPSQMRIAAVGLLKEAVLEGLTDGSQNMFASPLLLSAFGPIVLRPDPPDILDMASREDFLKGSEPLRLVECLGFYYVLLQRDRNNRTGVRDGTSLGNMKRALLNPLEAGLNRWKSALASDARGCEHDHDGALQLDILDMWVRRVYEAMAALGVERS